MGEKFVWTAEKEYSFSYRGKTITHKLFRNGIDGRLYQTNLYPNGPTMYTPTNLISNGSSNHTIVAELVSETLLNQRDSQGEWELIFKLPDINRYEVFFYMEWLEGIPSDPQIQFFMKGPILY